MTATRTGSRFESLEAVDKVVPILAPYKMGIGGDEEKSARSATGQGRRDRRNQGGRHRRALQRRRTASKLLEIAHAVKKPAPSASAAAHSSRAPVLDPAYSPRGLWQAILL